jgi:hypothetical protein
MWKNTRRKASRGIASYMAGFNMHVNGSVFAFV